jgi:hypothetical protein
MPFLASAVGTNFLLHHGRTCDPPVLLGTMLFLQPCHALNEKSEAHSNTCSSPLAQNTQLTQIDACQSCLFTKEMMSKLMVSYNDLVTQTVLLHLHSS